MQLDMDLRGLSDNTKHSYLLQIKHFLAHYRVPPDQLSTDDIRQYLHHQIVRRKLSNSSIIVCYSALRFFFRTTLGRDWEDQILPRMKPNRHLPNVLSKEEVSALINATTNLKHRALLMTAYSAGLRVSEIANLKITDIDSKNMQILIRQGKGDVDRYSLLAQKTLLTLRAYYKQYKPDLWLFPGQTPDKPLHPRSIGTVFKDAKNKIGIQRRVSIHSLRHSFATHLLESNVNIRYIQKLMGHRSIISTCVYLHVTRLSFLKITSPLDTLPGFDDDD